MTCDAVLMVYVYVFVCVFVRVYVCVYDRERERNCICHAKMQFQFILKFRNGCNLYELSNAYHFILCTLNSFDKWQIINKYLGW